MVGKGHGGCLAATAAPSAQRCLMHCYRHLGRMEVWNRVDYSAARHFGERGRERERQQRLLRRWVHGAVKCVRRYREEGEGALH